MKVNKEVYMKVKEEVDGRGKEEVHKGCSRKWSTSVTLGCPHFAYTLIMRLES